MPVLRAAQSREELSLLTSVTANLGDADALAVYCDWLEDHDDPRGPFLRDFLQAFADKRPLPPTPAEFSPQWAEVVGVSIRQRLRKGANPRKRRFAAYEPQFDEILKLLTPTVDIVLGKPTPLKKFPLGSTRAGGLPDLPAGMAWPHYNPASGSRNEPIYFLLQIDLAELGGTFAEGLLPETGLLSLFSITASSLDQNSPPALYYFPAGTNLRRYPADSTSPGFDGSEFMRSQLSRAQSLTLVDSLAGSIYLDEPDEKAPGLCNLTEGKIALNHSGQFCWRWTEAAYSWFAEGLETSIPTSHIKVFHLLSRGSPTWGFGDGGRANVYLAPADARAGRFESAIYYEV